MAGTKTVAGTVDRVEGDTIVVVVRDPDSGDTREVYAKKKQLKKVNIKEGDDVTVEISNLETVIQLVKKKPAAKAAGKRKPTK